MDTQKKVNSTLTMVIIFAYLQVFFLGVRCKTDKVRVFPKKS